MAAHQPRMGSKINPYALMAAHTRWWQPISAVRDAINRPSLATAVHHTPVTGEGIFFASLLTWLQALSDVTKVCENFTNLFQCSQTLVRHHSSKPEKIWHQDFFHFHGDLDRFLQNYFIVGLTSRWGAPSTGETQNCNILVQAVNRRTKTTTLCRSSIIGTMNQT